jgi:trk system potassium uptake protein TrkH
MRRILDLPLLVTLAGVAALAMFLPALHAAVQSDYATGRSFLYSGLVTLVLVALTGIATSPWRPRDPPRGLLAAMVLAYVVLPPVFALPFHQALPPGTPAFDAWFEMVSAFTTTGATLYEPQALGPTMHLWRALVGWLGGLFVLVAAVAILAPLNLGGFEIVSGGPVGHGTIGGAPAGRGSPPSERVLRYALAIFPVYGGLTLLLWLFLLLAGDDGLTALCHAMGTLSASGISPVGGPGGGGAGVPGEMLIFLFFIFAISRRAYVGTVLAASRVPLGRDPEIRVAAALLVALPAVQFLQHWSGLGIEGTEVAPLSGLLAFWGAIFTTLSFLTTTGYASAHWELSREWAGPGSSGLILLGLALIGGGVATTAGGVKLLRVWALIRFGERELESLIHPHSVGGDGVIARRIRNEGARVAWIFFVLFALSIFVVMAALTLTGLEFEPAMVFAVAALSTTGQLAGLAGDMPLSYAALPPAAGTILALAMVLGRLEMLALLVLLLPDSWRQ